MGIRRGDWKNAGIDHPPIIKTATSGPKPVGVGTSNTPVIGVPGNGALKNVSDFRRDMMLGSGSIGSGSSSSSVVPAVVYSQSYKAAQAMRESFSKTGGVSGVGSNYGRGGGASTVHQGPEVYSPLFQMANLQLPRDRITMNAWNRNFYDTHPLVRNCINLHATYPISKINIKCKNEKVERFFNEMAQEIDLVGILQAVAQEFWTIGEVFPYAELDQHTGKWKSISIQNPDYIHVKKSPFGDYSISLRPDAALMRLIQSNNPDDVRLVSRLDPEIAYHVRKGNSIPLDSFRVSHLKMLSSPYQIHGTSMIVSIYKDLMLYDKLRESKFAQADNLVNPITLIKVGGATEGEFHASSEDLENYRQIFEQAQYDKDFKIITHAGVSVERVGASGQIIDIAADMTFIVENILYGLMTPKVVITQDGASFNSASIGLEVLRQRYESFRNMMAQWLIRKIFAPISEIQEFYDYKDGEKQLIVPTVDWNHMSLYDMDNYVNVVKELATAQVPTVSKCSLFRSLGLSEDEERRKIKEETIAATIAQKETALLQTMSLGALRALKATDDLIEQTSAVPLPGTPGSMPGMGEESGMPGGAPGGLGGPDLGLGGGGLGDLGGLGGPPGGGLGGPPAPSPTTPGPATAPTTPAAPPAP
jgi:hypothetical protein